MNNWYQAKIENEILEVSVMDVIGEWGVTADAFIKDLRPKMKTAKAVKLSINSPGGSVFDGVSIYNFLSQYREKVDVEVLGVAASAASLIALAGKSLTMYDGTFLMIHLPWSIAYGNADDFRKDADLLDKIRDEMARIYSARAAITFEEALQMMEDETWIAASDAENQGFAVTYVPSQMAASIDKAALTKYLKTPDVIRAGIGPQIEKNMEEQTMSNETQGQPAQEMKVSAEITGAKEFSEAMTGFATNMKEILASVSVSLPGRTTIPGQPDARDGKIIAANGKKIETLGEMAYAMVREPENVRAALVSDGSSAAGYVLPKVYVAEAFKTAFEELAIYPRATKFGGTMGDMEMPAFNQTSTNYLGAGVANASTAEGSALTESTPVMRKISLIPYQLGTYVDVSEKMLATPSSAEAILRTHLIETLAHDAETNWLKGNGSAKATGIIGHAGTATYTRATASTFVYADAVGMLSLLVPSAFPRATWVISTAALGQVYNMLDAQNNRVFVPGNMATGIPDTLLGFPIVWTGRTVALGTDGDVLLGDFSSYLIHEGIGPQIAVSTEAAFKSGNVTIRANWYTNGVPGQNGTITLGNAVAASRIVQLNAA